MDVTAEEKRKLLQSYVFYQFKPIRLRDFIFRLVFTALIPLGAAIVEKKTCFTAVASILSIICGLICIAVYVFPSDPYQKRFTIDGVFVTYISIISNYGSSQLFTHGKNTIVTLLFFLLLILSSFTFLLITCELIKRDKYSKPTKASVFSPAIGAVLGLSLARLLVPNIPADIAERALAFLCLFSSLVFSCGVCFFQKLYYYRRIIAGH